MQRAIVEHLKPQFEPVAVVWSEAIPNDALEFTKGSFDMAREWLLHWLPRYDISNRYVLFKPLSGTDREDDTLTLTIPMPLFLHLEREVTDSVLQTPGWLELRPCARRRVERRRNEDDRRYREPGTETRSLVRRRQHSLE